MLRLIAFVFLSLLHAFPALAACGAGPDPEQFLTPAEQDAIAAIEDETANGSGTLWQATRDGRSVYIVGTMHLPDPRHAKTMEAVRPILRDINAVYLETEASGESEMNKEIASDPTLIFAPDKPTLPDLLDDATWAQLRDAMAARGFPAPLTAKMRPWYVSMMLSIPPCAMDTMISVVGGLDKMVERAALALDKPVRSLEDWQTIFSTFSEIPYQEQVDIMALSIMPDEVSEAAFTATLDAYFDERHARSWGLSEVLSHRIPGLTAEQIEAESARMQDLLLDRRNQNWLPVILDAVQDEDILVAVGAAHLIGENGLVALLENAGFALTRLPL
ncbi:TraB/GumN family protein [Donghicola sp. XS_ASV15]|uniref:TraB/GumN family protein n=1 Tax=Donghicola sp. XS_ASV15 TaxID=3241295 RepID=UPI0035188976